MSKYLTLFFIFVTLCSTIIVAILQYINMLTIEYESISLIIYLIGFCFFIGVIRGWWTIQVSHKNALKECGGIIANVNPKYQNYYDLLKDISNKFSLKKTPDLIVYNANEFINVVVTGKESKNATIVGVWAVMEQ